MIAPRIKSSFLGIFFIVAGVGGALGIGEIAAKLYASAQAQKIWINFLPSTQKNHLQLLVIGESSAQGALYSPKASPLEIAKLYVKTALPEYVVDGDLIARGGSILTDNFNTLENKLSLTRPDLIVAVVGHNTFLSAFGPNAGCAETATWYDPLIARSALASLILERWQKGHIADRPDGYPRHLFDVPIACPPRVERAFQDFRLSLQRLAQLAKEKAIPLLVILPAGNEKDTAPNRSVYTGSPGTKQKFETLFRSGRFYLGQGMPHTASCYLQKAWEIDPHFSGNLYWLGISKAAEGDLAAARESLFEAKERDAFPWRALRQHRLIVEELAAEFGFAWNDARDLFTSRFPNSLLGKDLFYDKHHVTLDGLNVLGHYIASFALTSLKHSSEEIPFLDSKTLASRLRFNKEDLLHVLEIAAKWYDGALPYAYEQLPDLQTMLDYMEAYSQLAGTSPQIKFGELYQRTCETCRTQRALFLEKPSEVDDDACIKSPVGEREKRREIFLCCDQTSEERFNTLKLTYPWLDHISD